MSLSLATTTAPTMEPVDIETVMRHLRVDNAEENADVQAIAVAAREYVESFTRRALVTQTKRLKLDRFPFYRDDFYPEIRLPVAPVSSITSITYTDQLGNAQTFDSSKYVVDLDNEPARIGLVEGQSWPDTRLQIGVVSITFVCGYGEANDVPDLFKRAILLLCGHWYENRDAVVVGKVSNAVKRSLDSILQMRRVVI